MYEFFPRERVICNLHSRNIINALVFGQSEAYSFSCIFLMLKLYCQVKHLNLLSKWPFVNNSPSFERVQKDFPVKLDPREPKENRFAHP